LFVCMYFLSLLLIVFTDEEFWFTGVTMEVLDKKANVQFSRLRHFSRRSQITIFYSRG
jgi:hypothetical protein